MPYLAALPGRDAFRTRITALYNFARTSVPFWEGGRWYYSKNSGLQKQNVWYSRATLTSAAQMVIDPNALSPDGSISLSDFTPSPDGRHYVYGQSEGGSDWSTLYVRDFATGRNTAGHGAMGQVQRHVVDEGRTRLLLRTVPRATRGASSSRSSSNTRRSTTTSSARSNRPT